MSEARPEAGDIAGLILAAGEGRRFGDGIKQLASFRGRPLIEHGISAMRSAVPGRIAVVLGHEAEKIRAGADLDGVEVVICEDWHLGQAASLRRGLEFLTKGPAAASAVVITLADQPLIAAAAIERVIAARRPGVAGARASYKGRAGHPVLLELPAVEAALSLSGDQGAGRLLKALGATLVPCDGLGSDIDLDTPERLLEVEEALPSDD